ncbi:hypothetical protein ACFY05_31985 [Microtetraspora fusca]|uniref:Uncharacterized protein n=1 Tax=Microtetraspora fusca TaxID=1997 RepID=A0ABW6VEZ9_MICFU
MTPFTAGCLAIGLAAVLMWQGQRIRKLPADKRQVIQLILMLIGGAGLVGTIFTNWVTRMNFKFGDLNSHTVQLVTAGVLLLLLIIDFCDGHGIKKRSYVFAILTPALLAGGTGAVGSQIVELLNAANGAFGSVASTVL